MPQWVDIAVENYFSRIPKGLFQLNLQEIAPIKRTQTANIKNIIEQESAKVLASIPDHFMHISLERTGKSMTSEKLANNMQNWLDDGQAIAISIGGAEGFPASHFKHCQQLWSFSELTLAHPVIRVVLAEQLYRGYSILSGHPYHRTSVL